MKAHDHEHVHLTVHELSFSIMWNGKNVAVRDQLMEIIDRAVLEVQGLTEMIPGGKDERYDTDGYCAPAMELVMESTNQTLRRYGEPNEQAIPVPRIDAGYEPNEVES